MEVTFYPYAYKNAYQDLLAGWLERFGCKVNLRTNDFVIRRLLVHRPEADIYHIHWIPAEPFNISKLLLRLILVKLGGTRVIWTIHNLYSHSTKHRKVEKWGRRAIGLLSDGIIVHCKEAKKMVRYEYLWGGKFRGVVSVIPHGSYIGAYPDNPKRAGARRKLDIKDGKVFLFFGMVKPYKSIPGLLGAFRELHKKHKDAVLVVAGQPEKVPPQLLEDIKSAKGVRAFLRYIPDEEVSTFFSAADCAVLPYRDVLTSGAAILAASFSKPVIAPNLGCLPESLPEENNFFYDISRCSALLNSMETAYLDKGLEDKGRDNFLKVANWSFSKAARDTLSLYISTKKRGALRGLILFIPFLGVSVLLLLKDRVRRFYEKFATLLERRWFGLIGNPSIGPRLRRRYVTKVLSKYLSKDKESRILDAGCGKGWFSHWVAANYSQSLVDAVDFDPEEVNYTKGRFGNLKNLTVSQESLTKFSRRNTYGLIYSVDVFEHIEDDQKAFKNIYAALKQGGVFVFHSPHGPRKTLLGVAASYEQADHAREWYETEELLGKLKKAGFEVIEKTYTFGPFGTTAWELMKIFEHWPKAIRWGFIAPITVILANLDTRVKNKWGTGILVVAKKRGEV